MLTPAAQVLSADRCRTIVVSASPAESPPTTLLAPSRVSEPIARTLSASFSLAGRTSPSPFVGSMVAMLESSLW